MLRAPLRPILSHLARSNSSTAFAKAQPVAKAFLVETIKTKTAVVAAVQSHWTAPYLTANVRFQAIANPPQVASLGA
ncbi:MAG: hypothetical protein CFE27_15355 [Alphaproteobacteria bacterium PA1]|nr:MAG: hypothetical protein CFE27_15355 [Alphaproteobacteria bacterium PA1]